MAPSPCCRCRSTNCLKRYCYCFSNEKLCSKACKCTECFNRLGNEYKIDRAHEETETRNPYAFVTEEVLSPSGGKLKKGCMCKVRMCSGATCKCYKGKVGCSLQCQCVGCENDYGKRGEDFDDGNMNRGEPLVQGTSVL